MEGDAIRTHVSKFIAAWTELILVACQLVAANSGLKSVAVGGKAAMDEFLAKQGIEKLKVVIGLRHKMTNINRKILALAESEEELFADFFKMKMPASFETELESEHFDDLAGHLVASRHASLEASVQVLADAVSEKRMKKGMDGELSDLDFLLQWSPGQEAWWKGLPEGASLELVEHEMNKTIYNIPAMAVQKFCKEIQED